jgi:acyl-CoA reductase-like NAD-dependent aldehyde dehydrogenase
LIRRASETVYGLAEALWTTNIKRAHGIADQLRAGAVWVNCYNIFDASMPVGG